MTRTYHDANDDLRALESYETRAQRIDASMTNFPSREYYRRIWQDERGELFAIISREVWSVERREWGYSHDYALVRPVGFTD